MRIPRACLLLCALVVSNCEVSGVPALTHGGGRGLHDPPEQHRGKEGADRELVRPPSPFRFHPLQGQTLWGKGTGVAEGALRTKGVAGWRGRSLCNGPGLLSPDL